MPQHVVYLIGPEFGDIKVGYSGNVKQRLRQLQTGHPDRLSILYTKTFESEQIGRLIEDRVKKRLGNLRKEGEWFAVSLELAMSTLDRIELQEGLNPEEQQRQLDALRVRSDWLKQDWVRITQAIAEHRKQLDALNDEFMKNLTETSQILEKIMLIDSK